MLKKAEKKIRLSRGRPNITVRLDRREIRQLDKLSKAMGSNRSDFVREFLSAALSDDVARIHEFMGKLTLRLALRAQMRLPGIGGGR